MTDIKKFVDNFYMYYFAKHLVEGNSDEGENDIDFDTVDILEEDSSDYHKSESENDGETVKLDFDSID